MFKTEEHLPEIIKKRINKVINPKDQNEYKFAVLSINNN
jgi:hypothetical protein